MSCGAVIVRRKGSIAGQSAMTSAFHAEMSACGHRSSAGRGSDQIARIAGQQPDYLSLTLKRYRDGAEVRANSIMTPNTKHLTNADIDAVVTYVSSMP